MRSLSIALFALLFVAACTYPKPSQIEQQDKRPAIGVSGAPADAALYVDGLDMGLASQFDGKTNVLLVESGSHLIEVKSADGRVLHSETVFLSGSTKKVFHIRP